MSSSSSNAWASKSTYSGYLDVQVPKASTGYDALQIHYELHTCRAQNCPLALWHQGGPGGSAVFGAWTEMGPFQLMAQGPVYDGARAWNQAAHMLYLESPAGSTIADQTGYSTCSIGGQVEDSCKRTDVTQAVAYAHTIEAFLAKFPEYKASELYLTGESYAGQYVPNIAYHLLQSSYSFTITGVAVGNGCWGGTATSVQCNGPHAEKNDIDIYYGKGMLPSKLYAKIQASCDWDKIAASGDEDNDSLPLPLASPACNALLEQAEDAVGPHNVYNIYDDCPLADAWHAANPRVSHLKVRAFRRGRMHVSRAQLDATFEEAFDVNGGYPWDCSSDTALDAYSTRADVKAALHLKGPGSGFKYKSSGPASQLLWPHLVQHMRVLIYNGDADLCVPYKGNEELVTNLETAGSLVEAAPWQPWYAEQNRAPAGYVTTYSVPGKAFQSRGGPDASFLTIRLAGHMVPTFQPEASLAFISRFFKGEEF